MNKLISKRKGISLLLIFTFLFFIFLVGTISADIYSEDDIYGTSVTNITHLTIYQNYSDYWDALDTPADINTADITDDNTYVTVAGDTMTGNLNVTGNISLEFGDLVSEVNPDGADAIRIKGTSDIDVVIGDMWGYFNVWNVADNIAVFTIDERGDTDIKGTLDMNTHKIVGVIDPTANQEVATKKYVDDLTINDAIYCESSELTDQVFAVAGVRYRLDISNVDEGNGISMSTGNNGTNITIDTSGVYHMVAQPQVKAGAGGAGDFHMWIEKFSSGSWADIPDSNIELKLSSLEEDVIVLATTLKLNQGEKLRLVVSVSDNKILLHAQSPVGEPVIPSIIFTMYRVGN